MIEIYDTAKFTKKHHEEDWKVPHRAIIKFEDIFNDNFIKVNQYYINCFYFFKTLGNNLEIYLLDSEEIQAILQRYFLLRENGEYKEFSEEFCKQTVCEFDNIESKNSFGIQNKNVKYQKNAISKTAIENWYELEQDSLTNDIFTCGKIQDINNDFNYSTNGRKDESFNGNNTIRENVYEFFHRQKRFNRFDEPDKSTKRISFKNEILSFDFISCFCYKIKYNTINNFSYRNLQNVCYRQVEAVLYANENRFNDHVNENIFNLCKIDLEVTDFEKSSSCERSEKYGKDFRRIKKKVANNTEYINGTESIRDNNSLHTSIDNSSVDDSAETKNVIEHEKDSSEIKKKVESGVNCCQIKRSVEECHRKFNDVGKMVDKNMSDNKFRSVYSNGYTRKSKRSGKGARISATRIVIVFAILIHHTDAIEGILGRLLREALGWGACPGLPWRPCTLALSCWARGGSTAPAETCGPSWLLTCCGPTPEGGLVNQLNEGYREDFTVGPPQITLFKSDPLDSSGGTWRRTPQIANNVFRRRIDDNYDDESDCGVAGGSDRVLQKRIIGGRAAQLAEFPWQAHIRIGDYQCGGVLVSRWFVATAAHCVQRAHSRDIAVWLGALDTRAQAPPAEKHRVVQKIIHPLFRYRVTQPDRYDLALLMLSRPAILGFNVLPVCLPSSTWATPDRRYRVSQEDNNNFWSPDESLAGRKALVAGWGSTGNGGAPRGTHRLRSAVVPILSTEECIVWHKSKQISVEIHSEMICAGHSDGHQDACLGDSGGPLVVPKDGRYYLVGITSAGFGCGVDHQPGIYHNVLVTSHWIRHMIRR